MAAFTKLDLEEQVRKYVVDLQVETEELINATPKVKFRTDFAARVGT